MKNEYVIWGIPKGENVEAILYTKAQSEPEANKVMKFLVDKYGASKVRLQVIEFKSPFVNFDNIINS